MYSSGTAFKQHTLQSGFAVSNDDNYYGALSYGIKSADVSKYGISLLEGAFKANCVSFSSNGYVALGYNPSANSGKAITADTLYNIGLIFKKDGKYDCYIDGEKFGTGDIGTIDSTKTTVDLKFNQDGGGSHTMRNISWYKDFAGSQFAAQADDAVVTPGRTLTIRFSAPIADVSGIKLYSCKDGSEISGAEYTYHDYALNVTIPQSGMEVGNEYRIDISGVKDSFGRTSYNDNIYFNCRPEEVSVVSETFDTFDGSKTPTPYADQAYQYYRVPEHWYIKKAENASTARYVYPQKTDKGTSVKIGSDDLWNGAGMYLPLAEKITVGTVSISYDIKPLYYAADAYGGNTAQNIMLEVYPEGADTNINYNIAGKDVDTGARAEFNKIGREINFGCSSKAYAVSGVRAGALGRPKTDILKGFDTFNDDNNWESIKAFTKNTDLNEAWYNVRVEMDFDSNTMTWYLDGEKCAEDTSLMAACGIKSIGGLGFYKDSYTEKSLSLIDNVKVTTQAQQSGTVKSVRFSDCNSESYGAATTLTTLADTITAEVWDGIDAGNAKITLSKGGAAIAETSGTAVTFDYLDKNSEYTVTVSGLKDADGNAVDDYVQSIKTNAKGEIVVIPTNGSSVAGGVKIINTTGTAKKYTLGAAAYDGDGRFTGMTHFERAEIGGTSKSHSFVVQNGETVGNLFLLDDTLNSVNSFGTIEEN